MSAHLLIEMIIGYLKIVILFLEQNNILTALIEFLHNKKGLTKRLKTEPMLDTNILGFYMNHFQHCKLFWV